MKQFVSRVHRNIHIFLIRESTSQDLEKSRYSHHEWHRASKSIFNQLDQQLKERRFLLFFSGAKYEISYNKDLNWLY